MRAGPVVARHAPEIELISLDPEQCLRHMHRVLCNRWMYRYSIAFEDTLDVTISADDRLAILVRQQMIQI